MQEYMMKGATSSDPASESVIHGDLEGASQAAYDNVY
jgi:hypothetical protein